MNQKKIFLFLSASILLTNAGCSLKAFSGVELGLISNTWLVLIVLSISIFVCIVSLLLFRFNQRLREEIVKRQRIEDTLNTSENKMHSIFRVAPAGIGVIVDRKFQDVNRTFCRMVGYTREELSGNSSRMIYPSQQEFDRVGKNKYDQIHNTGSGVVETCFRRKDGSTFDVLLASTPIDANDFSQGVTFTALDITDRKQAEKRFVEANHRLKSILNSIPADIYVSDMETHEILYMNQHMISTFGSDLTGDICWKAFRNGDKPCDHCNNAILVDENGQPEAVNVWEGMNPVSNRYYLNHDLAMRWIDDRLARIQIAIDITGSKEAEAAIKESEALFRTTVNAMHEGFLVSDKNLIPVFANKRFFEMTGLDENELDSADINDFLTEDSLIRLIREFEKNALKGIPSTIEVQGIRKDGEIRDFLLSGSPIMKNGKFERGVSIYSDITDRKKAEKQVMASLKEKETLLQEIHHRVKNNMAVIGSLLNLQSINTEDPDVKNILLESRNRVFAMAAVHEALYKSDSLAVIDSRDYITNISKTLFQAYSVHSSRVSLFIEADNIQLTAEKASPLGLIINELISNSLKYAFPDQREGKITVALKKLEEHLTISISDDGIGMPVDLDWWEASTLGFKLVRTLVENQLEGTISRQEGPGTTFDISVGDIS